MNNIDILEELKKEFDGILKEPMGKDEMSNGNLYEYERSYELNLEEIKAVETLIAENKELKEIVETLRKENVEAMIQRRQYELHYIPKSKVEGLIKEINIEIQCCEYADDDIEEYKKDMEKEKLRLLRDKKVLQSLLGKE